MISGDVLRLGTRMIQNPFLGEMEFAHGEALHSAPQPVSFMRIENGCHARVTSVH
jgi:hypothetical protein